MQFPDFTVEIAPAQHSTLKPEVLAELSKLFDLDTRPGTTAGPGEEARAKVTFAPEVITQGTLAFAFTFESPTLSSPVANYAASVRVGNLFVPCKKYHPS